MKPGHHRAASLSFIVLLLTLLARPFLLEQWNSRRDNQIRQSGLRISEISREVGIHFEHRMLGAGHEAPNWPWLEGLGAAVAVADVNEDGYQDILFNTTSPYASNGLFINQKNGTFKEAGAEFGLDHLKGVTGIMRPVFFDCDNDGHKELLIFHHGYPAIFKKDGQGRFQNFYQISGNKTVFPTGAGSVIDLDGDGYLDIIFGGESGTETPRSYNPFNMVNTTNGSNVSVYRNDGQCRFSEEPGRIQVAKKLFYNAVGVGDLRNTGKRDLWLAVEFNEDRPILAQDNGRFEEATRSKAKVASYSGMNADIAYLDPFFPSVFVSHVYKTGFLVSGNALWKYVEGKFENQAADKGLHQCGWAWGGKFFDLDNDGGLDLAVVNGFYSGPKKAEYWFTFASLSATSRSITYQSNRWPPMGERSLSGYEADCLFLNHAGHFEQVPSDMGFDPDRLDGRGVATIDTRNDGSLDLVVANHKGRPYFYHIEPLHRGHWIGFSLKGNRRSEVGAKVRIHTEGGIQTREAISTNTFVSQSDDRIHFGLGKEDKVKEVEIWWPSGKHQKLNGLASDRYYPIQEL